MLAFARPGREERCSIKGGGGLGASLIGKAAHRSWPGRFDHEQDVTRLEGRRGGAAASYVRAIALHARRRDPCREARGDPAARRLRARLWLSRQPRRQRIELYHYERR